ncbi:MAG TPA: potassium/proton antiporter [Mycobacteriales bacterium]|nr:potassium/proton antiporter [Mycobacteriales bacterium]
MAVNDMAPELALAVGAVVVLVGVLAVRLSARFGLPSLLIYLGIGVVIGENVIGVQFNDADLARLLGMWALVLILAEGGLTTRWSAVRDAVPLAVVISTVGVAVSTAITGALAVALLGLDWRTGLLLGAVVSSTDAAAVFSTLRRLTVRHRIMATLELESGFNDAPAVILVTLLSASTAFDGVRPVAAALAMVAYELVVGAVLGVAVGWLGAAVLRRSALPVAGLYPLATVAFAVLAYATTTLLHASGFLAVYLAALVLGNARLPHRQATLGFAEGLAWLAQIGLFVLLGLLATPSRLPDALWRAVAIGGVLLLLARPVSVLLSAVWFRVPWREQAFISWAGLRGAVPIVLATIPMSYGLRDGDRLFDIVFVLVVVFTLVQGTSLPAVARLLQVAEPDQAREVEVEAAPLGELDADLLQITIPARSRLHGVYIDELRLPEQAVVSLLVRDGRARVPGPATRLNRGDQLLVVATAGCRDATERRLRAVSRAGRLARWYGETGSPRGH